MTSKHRQAGFNIIELGQIVYILATLFVLDLVVRGNPWGLPLSFLLVNLLALVFLFAEMDSKRYVRQTRFGRIVFFILVILSAAVVWWLKSFIAVFVGAVIAYWVPAKAYSRLMRSSMSLPGEPGKRDSAPGD